MKRFLLIAMATVPLLFAHSSAEAQRGRYHRSYSIYRSRPMVTIGMSAGFYGTRIWGYGRPPGVGVHVGVMVPPPGSRVRALPPGATQTEINGITYYQHNNLYFRERRDGGYETVEAPIGARLSRLPMGAKLKKIDGKYYYEKEGTIYYKWDEDGTSSYEIVGKDGALDIGEEYYEADSDEEPPTNGRPYDEEEDLQSMDQETDSSANTEAYPVRPQLGDQFDRLPRNSKEVRVNGTIQYVSPSDIYYKEVTVDGKTYYEVVKVN